MAILPILEAPDPSLRVISPLVKTINDELRTQVADILEKKRDAPESG